MKRFSIAAIALGAVLTAPSDGAQARIVCDGNFQIVQGRPIATPYCQEQNLARIARSYGMRASFDQIRASISVKGQVCRAIGHDIRVRETCQPYRIEDGATFR
ncbi:MAG: hypothetical protein K2X43_00965 [Hyphomonadaceae bacterium]|jgi:hypothetical protein|nr:hypothetical protein [Hyphomonadaceae bacterium]